MRLRLFGQRSARLVIADRTGIVFLLMALLASWWGREASAEEPRPPQAVQALWERAGARLRFVDRSEWPRPFDGWTDYRIDVKYKFVSRWEGSGKRWRLSGKITEWEVQRTALVLMPTSYQVGDPWATPLARHELDHLRVIAHPRIDALLDRLREDLPVIRLDSPPDEATAEPAIREQIEARIHAVVKLVGQMGEELDRQTEHGVRPLFEEWLDQLYSEADLKRFEFPYLEEVRSLVRTQAYRNLKLEES